MVFLNSVPSWLAALLLLCLWSSTSGTAYRAEDCCLTTSDRRIPRRLVVSFIIQTDDGACRIPATIFVTWKGVKLCAPFPSENNWVSNLIDYLVKRPGRPTKPREKKLKRQ